MEVNTRLQVEHPITEERLGIDLVALQIQVAQGTPLPFRQEDILGQGYALELRLYAEDPLKDFLPASGTIWAFDVPHVEGFRVETAVQTGSEISIHYDPLIAKLIMKGASREEVIRRMSYVLDHIVCSGIATNREFLRTLLANRDFQQGNYTTHFIEEKGLINLLAPPTEEWVHRAAIACTCRGWSQREVHRTLLNALPSGWRNNFYMAQVDTFSIAGKRVEVTYTKTPAYFKFSVGNQEYQAVILAVKGEEINLEIDQQVYTFHISCRENTHYVHSFGEEILRVERLPRFPLTLQEGSAGTYDAPMPAQVLKVFVATGQKVNKGEKLLLLSSMKMETAILAESDGIIVDILVKEQQTLKAGAKLLEMGPPSHESQPQS